MNNYHTENCALNAWHNGKYYPGLGFDLKERTKAERDKLASEIRHRGIRRREFQQFITALEKLPENIAEFDEALWGSLVEHMTVYSKDDIRFTLPCGIEISG